MEKEMSELLISVQEQARSLSQSNEKLLKKHNKLKQQLEWYNHFVDYINQVDSSQYNQACEYADNCESS